MVQVMKVRLAKKDESMIVWFCSLPVMKTRGISLLRSLYRKNRAGARKSKFGISKGESDLKDAVLGNTIHIDNDEVNIKTPTQEILTSLLEHTFTEVKEITEIW